MMTEEIDIKRVCLYVRGGVEVWLPEEKAESLGTDLVEGQNSKFMKIEGRIINSVDIIGIFSPEDLDAMKREKRGQWKCKYNNWHNKNEECICGRQH